MDLLEDNTVCEFYLLVNKLKHMVARNIRFTEISGATNVHSKECTDGLCSLGMEKPGPVLWRLLQLLSTAGVLSFQEHGDYDSVLAIDVVVQLWESLPANKAQVAA